MEQNSASSTTNSTNTERTEESTRRQQVESTRILLKTSIVVQRIIERVYGMTPRQGCAVALTVASWAAITVGMSRQEFLQFADDVFVNSRRLQEATEAEDTKKIILAE